MLLIREASARLGTTLVAVGFTFAALAVASCVDGSESAGQRDEAGGDTSADSARSGSDAADTSLGSSPDPLDPLADVANQRPSGESITVTVTRVPDGDSFEVRLPDGSEEKVRLLGMNANESDTCFGPEAGERLKELIDQATTIELVLGTDDGGRDDFDRLLAYLLADGVNLNYVMVREGMAVARDQSGHELAGAFEAAEADAVSAGRGLWAADACGEPSGADVTIVGWEANARGPDDENRNGEFVVLENSGAESVDLLGWSVRDESTRHRHEFGSVELAAGERLCLYTGDSDEPVDEPCDGRALFWDADGSVWNNGGDTIFVLDASGNIVDSEMYVG